VTAKEQPEAVGAIQWSQDGIPYLDFGGQGRLLHLAHANGFPPGSYRGLAELLRQRGRVIGIAQRPLWPGSDWRKLENWKVLGEDLIRFLDPIEEAAGRPGLIGIGHSLGGVATIYAALARPDLFRALVLIEPVLLPPALLRRFELGARAEIERHPLVQGAWQRRFVWSSRQEAFHHFRPKPVFARFSDRALRDYVNSVIVPAPAGFQSPMAGEAHETEAAAWTLAYPREWEARIYETPPTDIWRALASLDLPMLALRGAETDTIEIASWQEWQRIQPKARFVNLASLGHLLPLEAPERVAGEIRDFLADLS
jgi:pimeloyl-ACP methyl ester carboxylesterase